MAKKVEKEKKQVKPGTKEPEKKNSLLLEADEMLSQDKAVTALGNVSVRYKEYLELYYRTQKEVRETKPAPTDKLIAERLLPLRVVCDEESEAINRMAKGFLERFPSLTGELNATQSMFDSLPKDGKEKAK